MRAYRFDGFDLAELNVHEEPVPRAQRGEVLVKIHHVALNYRDIAPLLGRYTSRFKPGLIPCSDASGEIVDVGEGVRAFSPGDRVISTFHQRWFGGRVPSTLSSDTYGAGSDGWLTEYKAVSQEAIVRLPGNISFQDGATLPCAATTAWNSLSGPSPVRAGDTVLTLGTGGVAIFALQLAKGLGARVIATTSSPEKAERLLALGADDVVDYNETTEWGRHIKSRLTNNNGVDRVVEVGGPATITQSLYAVRWGGEVVLIGFLTDDNPGIDYFLLKESGATTRSIAVGDRATLADSVRAWSSMGLRTVIDTIFPFSDSVDAFRRLQSRGHVGKIVIRVSS